MTLHWTIKTPNGTGSYTVQTGSAKVSTNQQIYDIKVLHSRINNITERNPSKFEYITTEDI
ncbi:MAG: hypothetical protein [Caudoviricetes sp.]|nr:MAG: hypothetical protein [Caudoviricetes sp.]